MELPIYKLIINPEDETGVEFVSLVTKPAIERDFQYFNDQFVDPRPGESKDDFVARCIPIVMNEGKDNGLQKIHISIHCKKTTTI